MSVSSSVQAAPDTGSPAATLPISGPPPTITTTAATATDTADMTAETAATAATAVTSAAGTQATETMPELNQVKGSVVVT